MTTTTHQHQHQQPSGLSPSLSVPRVFAAIVLGSVALSSGYAIMRPVIWGVQGRVTVMRDSVPAKEGAVLVPRAGEQSMMREAAKGSEWEVRGGIGGATSSPGDDNENDDTTPGDHDHHPSADDAAEDASDGGGGERGGGEGGGGSDDDDDAGPPVDLSKLPVQFAGMRDTVDISAEVRASMMEAGWREPIVNTTSPRHLYAQLRAELRGFVRARGRGRGEGSGGGGNDVGRRRHDDPSIAAMGSDSRGVVYMALGKGNGGKGGGTGWGKGESRSSSGIASRSC